MVVIRDQSLLFGSAESQVQFSFGGPAGGPNGDGVDCHQPRVPIHQWTFPDASLSCHSAIGKIGISEKALKYDPQRAFAFTQRPFVLGCERRFFSDDSGNWTVHVEADRLEWS